MLALLLLAALVTAGPPWRRGLGLALAALLLPCSLALPGPPLLQGVVALLAFWGFARIVDLAGEARPMPPLARLIFAAAIIDTRRLQPAAPHLDRRALLRLAVWVPLGLCALHTALAHDPGPLRWACGALAWPLMCECSQYGSTQPSKVTLKLNCITLIGRPPRSCALQRRPVQLRRIAKESISHCEQSLL